MTTTLRSLLFTAVVCVFATPTSAQQAVPNWVSRGMPGAGHAALAPLVGSWHAELSIYGTMGRSPDLPPIVSRDIRTTRIWIADKQYHRGDDRRHRRWAAVLAPGVARLQQHGSAL